MHMMWTQRGDQAAAVGETNVGAQQRRLVKWLSLVDLKSKVEYDGRMVGARAAKTSNQLLGPICPGRRGCLVPRICVLSRRVKS